MKRYGHLYDQVLDRGNVVSAIEEACDNKKKSPLIVHYLDNAESEADLFLLDPHPYGDYKPGKVTDPSSGKTRDILKPSMHDQILHHSLIRVTGPYMEKGAYALSCGAIKERGPLFASKHVTAYLDKNRKRARWFVKLDIVKYYEHVDRAKLKSQLADTFKDPRLLGLFYEIIDGIPGTRGIPIGNLTSQYFANFHLKEFDRWVKETLKADFYLRYMDDMLLIDANKRRLRKIIAQMAERLKAEFGMGIHPEKAMIRRVQYRDKRLNKRKGTMIDICGYRHGKQKKRAMRRRKWKRLRRGLLRIKGFICLKRARSLASRYGDYKHTNHFRIALAYGAKKLFGLACAYIGAHDKIFIRTKEEPILWSI